MPRYEVTCPYCAHCVPWEPQQVSVIVKCPNREITGQIDGRPQKAAQMYGHTDGSHYWIETYLVQGPMREPKWRCGRWFRVKAVRL